MVAPPSFTGACQRSVTRPSPEAAVRPVGRDGVSCGVAVTVFGSLAPATPSPPPMLNTRTLKLYDRPLIKLLTVTVGIRTVEIQLPLPSISYS